LAAPAADGRKPRPGSRLSRRARLGRHQPASTVDGSYHTKNIKKNLVVSCLDQRPGFSFNYDHFKDFDIWENNSPHSGNLKKKN